MEGEPLDWKALTMTFALIFIAELGDKTQLATMMMAAETRSFLAVFTGAALALVLSSLLGAAAGEVLTRFIPLAYLRGLAGAGFVVMGLLLLSGRL